MDSQAPGPVAAGTSMVLRKRGRVGSNVKMPNDHTAFWPALLDYASDQDQRTRLWNGYIGWKLPAGLRTETPRSGSPRYLVRPPPDGWPELTESERSELDILAKAHGGHPTWRNRPYMDFSGSMQFKSEVDLSDLTLVDANFRNVQFFAEVSLHSSRFFMQARFEEATFYAGADFWEAYFESHVTFNHVNFMGRAEFGSVEFNGGAIFDGAIFERHVNFNDSIFVENSRSRGIILRYLASFKGVEFRGGASFCNVVFGEEPTQSVKRLRPRRLAEFSDAQFHAATEFRQAVFNGAPAFFNCRLHEDTDFSLVHWPKAMPDRFDVEYAIRAWERLELMMSQLEKPLDRHRFFCLKMRARRLKDGKFLCVVNYLFDVSSDYGWSLACAARYWVGHWLLAGLVLFVNTGQAAVGGDWPKLLSAALGTAFANAHAFLALAGKGGYLESCRVLIGQHDHWGLLAAVGVTQAILGPVLLFLLLLTMRNRFRLA